MQKDGGRARALIILAHSAIYEFPLTASEVRARWWRMRSEQLPPQHRIDAYLQELVVAGLVGCYMQYYSIGDPATVQRWVANRSVATSLADSKRVESQGLVDWLSRIGWIRAVAITGSVAMNSAQTDDDIDFFIIVGRNRLWLTRLLVVMYAIFKKKRRSFAREEPNSWCFNLWLEEGSEQLPTSARSLYSAYEVCQAKWLFERDRAGRRFLLRNHWVFPHLPVLYLDRWSHLSCLPAVATQQTIRRTRVISALLSRLVDGVNYCAYLLQLAYMQPHRTRERIGRHYAYFHPQQRNGVLLSALWQQVGGGVRRMRAIGGLSPIRVLVTGVFDVLHEEHVRFLEKSRALADYLLIAIERDVRVRVMKGEGRPINSEQERVNAVKRLRLANGVELLPAKFDTASDHLRLLQRARPTYLAVSSHTAHQLAKRQLMHKVGGGVVVVHGHNPNISSTILIARRSK